MAFYETVFIARQELSSSQVEALTEQFCTVLKDNGAKIHKTEQWGLRTLAYRIKKSRRGFYVLIESDAPAAALHEMERQMRLHEDVLRYMSIKEEELSTGPSVILDKDRDNRDDNRNDRDDNRNKNTKEAA